MTDLNAKLVPNDKFCVRELGEVAACVVDAGSAVTIDVIQGDGQHLGGVIAPGFDLMRSAVGGGTAGVPVAGSPRPARLEPGRSTRAGLENGILYSLVALQQFVLVLVIGLGFFDVWLNFRKQELNNRG